MSNRLPLLKECIPSRTAATILASSALLGMGGEAEAVGQNSNQSQNKQTLIQSIDKRSTSCDDRRGLVVSLRGRQSVRLNEKERFTLVVKSCKKEGSPYEDITLQARGPQRQKKTLEIAKLKYKQTIKKKVRFIFAKSSETPKVSANIRAKKDAIPVKDSVGWRLSYAYLSNSDKTPFNVMPVLPKNCTPRPDFYVGMGDDAQTVYQRDTDRETALKIGRDKLGATALRFIVTYGEVKEIGYQPYIDAIESAKLLGYSRFHVTLSPTTSYQQHLNTAYNFSNPNLEEAKGFTKEAVTELAPHGVTSWSPVNEPDHYNYFSPQTPQAYIPFYNASYDIIKTMSPNAKVYAGELSPGRTDFWISPLNRTRNDGIALHPYGPELLKALQHVEWSKTPIMYSEYGNFADDPEQEQKNKAAIAVARCVGAEAISFHQVIRDPTKPWDTGIVDKP